MKKSVSVSVLLLLPALLLFEPERVENNGLQELSNHINSPNQKGHKQSRAALG